MGKGKVIGAVAAAVAVPAAVIVGAIYILPALGISSTRCITSAMILLSPQTAQYRSARRKCLATTRNTPTL